jgi:integrase
MEKTVFRPYLGKEILKRYSSKCIYRNRNPQRINVLQVEKFFKAVDSISNNTQIRLAIRFLLILGLRKNELINIRWNWLNSDFTNLTFPSSMAKVPCTIPVPQCLVELLIQHHDETRRQWANAGFQIPSWIFWKPDGTSRWINFTNQTIQKAATAIGLEGNWRPYQLRSSCTLILYELGIPRAHICRLLRYRDRGEMECRIQVTVDQLRASQSRFAALL